MIFITVPYPFWVYCALFSSVFLFISFPLISFSLECIKHPIPTGKMYLFFRLLAIKKRLFKFQQQYENRPMASKKSDAEALRFFYITMCISIMSIVTIKQSSSFGKSPNVAYHLHHAFFPSAVICPTTYIYVIWYIFIYSSPAAVYQFLVLLFALVFPAVFSVIEFCWEMIRSLCYCGFVGLTLFHRTHRMRTGK